MRRTIDVSRGGTGLKMRLTRWYSRDEVKIRVRGRLRMSAISCFKAAREVAGGLNAVEASRWLFRSLSLSVAATFGERRLMEPIEVIAPTGTASTPRSGFGRSGNVETSQSSVDVILKACTSVRNGSGGESGDAEQYDHRHELIRGQRRVRLLQTVGGRLGAVQLME